MGNCFFSSTTIDKKIYNVKQNNLVKRKRVGRKPFDINTRVVIAFREMGKGLLA